jgi:hypothetical protein
MNQLAPDVSLVGEIALKIPQRVQVYTQHIAPGNHDFDFGMLKKLYAVLHLLKKVPRISTPMYTDPRYQICR